MGPADGAHQRSGEGAAGRVPHRRRGPLVVVVLAALVPAAGLAGLWWWADGQRPPPPEPIPTAPAPSDPVPELTTDLASLRRAPAPVAAELAEAELLERVGAEVEAALADHVPGSCAAVDLDGRQLAAVDADRTVTPASNQKMFVGAVALEVLDPDEPLATEVRGPAPVDGVVAGDLWLVGGGDPLLRSAEDPAARPTAVVEPTSFDALADAVVAAGVTRVEGDVVGDGSRYDDELAAPTWGPEITRADVAPIGALVVNEGRIFGAGVGLDPAQSAANELNRLLRARGVTIAGGNRTGVAPDEVDGAPVVTLGRVESAPVGDLVTEMLVASDNQIAETLLKEIGVVGAGEGSRTAGLTVVRERLAARGVGLEGAVLDDGSGLSRTNAVSCRTVLDLLASEPVDGRFAGALPVVGVDGSVADVLAGTPADGVAPVKTGTLTDVKALSGYVPLDAGPTAAGQGGDVPVARFSILLAGPDVDDPAVHVPVWERVIGALDAYPVDPRVDELGPR